MLGGATVMCFYILLYFTVNALFEADKCKENFWRWEPINGTGKFDSVLKHFTSQKVFIKRLVYEIRGTDLITMNITKKLRWM